MFSPVLDTDVNFLAFSPNLNISEGHINPALLTPSSGNLCLAAASV